MLESVYEAIYDVAIAMFEAMMILMMPGLSTRRTGVNVPMSCRYRRITPGEVSQLTGEACSKELSADMKPPLTEIDQRYRYLLRAVIIELPDTSVAWGQPLARDLGIGALMVIP